MHTVNIFILTVFVVAMGVCNADISVPGLKAILQGCVEQMIAENILDTATIDIKLPEVQKKITTIMADVGTKGEIAKIIADGGISGKLDAILADGSAKAAIQGLLNLAETEINPIVASGGTPAATYEAIAQLPKFQGKTLEIMAIQKVKEEIDGISKTDPAQTGILKIMKIATVKPLIVEINMLPIVRKSVEDKIAKLSGKVAPVEETNKIMKLDEIQTKITEIRTPADSDITNLVVDETARNKAAEIVKARDALRSIATSKDAEVKDIVKDSTIEAEFDKFTTTTTTTTTTVAPSSSTPTKAPSSTSTPTTAAVSSYLMRSSAGYILFLGSVCVMFWQ